MSTWIPFRRAMRKPANGPGGALAAATWIATSLTCASVASAQYPQPAPEPYPAPPPAAAPYPAPPPPPAAAQPYPPPLPAPPPTYAPPPAYAPPPTYAPPPAYAPPPFPAPFAPPAPVLQPPPPPPNRYRSPQEMGFLYGTSVAYGIGTGVWIDALARTSDPGIAVLAPAAFGAGVPIGLYLWDQYDEFDRGVPSTIATGMMLGAIEGIAIDGLQWQLTGNGGPHSWDFRANTSVAFLTATAGGVGGYAFGEWFQPDPRNLALIASGAGWGSITGVLFGAGVVGGDWKDGAAVWGFAGYNAGIVASAVVSTVYTPSWQTLRYMWLGEVLGTLATTPVYLFYIGSSADPRHGLIANAVGGLAGLAIAAVFTANMNDGPGAASWTPPFQVAFSPMAHGGAQLQAFGTF